MSLQSLISGSECAISANPLSQVLKHTETDRSLHHDRLAAPSTSQLQQISNTSPLIQLNEHDLALARQFFDGNPQSQGLASLFFPPLQAGSIDTITPQVWSAKGQPQTHHGPWAEEFSMTSGNYSSGSQTREARVSSNGIQRTHLSHAPAYPVPTTRFYGMGPSNFSHTNPSIFASTKGKAKEIDFEAAFAQLNETVTPLEQGSSVIEAKENATEVLEKAFESVSLKEQEEDATEAFWDPEDTPANAEMAKWEAELSQLLNSERDHLQDLGNDVQRIYEADDYPKLRYSDEGIPQLDPYVFETSNRYMESPKSSADLLAEAKALLEQNGSFSEAALLFEAAIQRGELGDGGYEAWVLLGETRNMDEREDLGIRALMEGVKQAEAVNSSAGMLSLAISFTNESLDKASHTMLLRWFRMRYPDFPVPEDTAQTVKTSMAWVSHEKLTELFLDLARKHHAEGRMDEDLQTALGVLFYTVGEYSRAHDCFSAALTARPKDYRLWNRLGSCLTNGRRPEEALGAYREALQLRPTYTRAIFNVGVACLNLGADKEAAEHFLSALSLQESSGTTSETSDSPWSTLRKALYAMDRSDLAELARPENRVNLDIFRKEGFDF